MPDPIEVNFRTLMDTLAHNIDAIFNGDCEPAERTVAFVLLVANMGEADRIDYISNADRASIITMLKELVALDEKGQV